MLMIFRAGTEEYISRDVYNNQDGNLPCEPSLYGERPQGYIGLVPRLRFNALCTTNK